MVEEQQQAPKPKQVVVVDKLLPRSSRTGTQRMDTARQNAVAENSIKENDFAALGNQIQAINRNLVAVQELLKLDFKLDNKEFQDERQRSKKDADIKKKVNKEKFIEGSVIKKLTKPIVALGTKTKGLMGRLMDVLKNLFLGFLADKGLKALKAYNAGDTKTLENIRDNLIKVGLVAVGVFAAFQFGIPLIISGITALVGAIISSIPAILSLLANPVVWMGIAAVMAFNLAKTNVQSDAERQIAKAVADANGDRQVVIDNLKEELKKAEEGDLTGNIFQRMFQEAERNTVIAEIKKQIKALEMGYYGTGDPRYRKAGAEGSLINSPALGIGSNEDKRYLWQGTDKTDFAFERENLVKLAKNVDRTEPQLATLQNLTGLYRDMSRIRQAQFEYQEQIKKKTNVEGAKIQIDKLEIQFQQTLKEVRRLKASLPEGDNNIINTLAMRVLNLGGIGSRSEEPGPDGKLGTLDDTVKDPLVYEQIARIMARIYPGLDDIPISTTKTSTDISDVNMEAVTPNNINEDGNFQENFTPMKDIDNAISNAREGFSNIYNNVTENLPTFEFVPDTAGTGATSGEGDGEDGSSPTVGINIPTANPSNDYLYHYISVYSA